MSKHLLVLLAIVATSAWAQPEDDELAPLPQLKSKAKVRVAPKAKVGLQPKSPGGGKRWAPRPPRTGTEELVTSKTELVVRVGAEVTGASLAVDGRLVGTLPLGPQALAPGDHLVTVSRLGYAAFSRKVQLGAGKTVELEARLSPVAAVLAVVSDVPDAEVRVDGRLVGQTPLEGLEVPPGSVEVAVTKEGYAGFRVQLSVAAGRDYPLQVALEPSPVTDQPRLSDLSPAAPTVTAMDLQSLSVVSAPTPVSQRWYFWVGVGVAVAGVATAAAIGATAVLSPRSYTAKEICGDVSCDGCINLACMRSPPPMVSF